MIMESIKKEMMQLVKTSIIAAFIDVCNSKTES